jgi:hypothetical protein
MSITPTFQGEMQLAGWNQTHNGGSKVTFWLPDDSDLEPFKGLTAKKGNTAGHRFMVVLVEIGDDEQPVNSTVKESLTIEKNKGGELAKWSGILCNDPMFWEWIESTSDEYGHLVVGHTQAAEFIYSSCNVTSRAQLDHNFMSAMIFREEVMAKFDAWKGEQ